MNTVGGVLGSATAGFALIPVVGVRDGVITVAAISVAVGGALLVSEPAMRYRSRLAAVAVTGVLLGAGVVHLDADAIVLTSYYERQGQREILSYEERIGATVNVYRDEFGERTLSVDGFPVAAPL